MNKLFSKIASLSVGLAMAVGVGVALGHESVKEVKAADTTVTWTATAANNLGAAISSAGGTNSGSVTLSDGGSNEFSLSYTRTLVNLKSGKSDYIAFMGSTWIQLGSSNSLESLSFTTSAITGKIKSVSVVAATAGTHKLTIDVGGTKYKDAADLTVYSGGATATNPDPSGCAVTGTGTSTGALTITIASSATTTNKAMLIRSVSVTYEPASSDPAMAIRSSSWGKSPFELTYGDTEGLDLLGYDPDHEGDVWRSGMTWSFSNDDVVNHSENGDTWTYVTPKDVGSVTVTCSKEGYQDGVAVINVVPGTLSTVTVSGSMTKTSYYVGEAWNPAGLTVTATYDSGYVADVTSEAEWSYNPAAPAKDVTSVVATASFGGKSGSSSAQSVTVTKANPIQALYTQSAGASVDVYGYYVGFLTGTGPVIMDGEYGIVIYNNSADVSGYTEGETILHVTGSISIYKGLYEIGSASMSIASGTYDVPSKPVVYSTAGGETAEYASRLTTVTGVPSVSGDFPETAGASDITISMDLGNSKSVQVFYKKAAQNADAEAFAAMKSAVAGGTEITIKGFTGWYNGFQVQMNGYVPAAEGYTAEDFAQDLLDQTDAVCAGWKEGDNNHDALEAIWTNLASNDKYPSLPSDQKTILAEAERDESGTVVEQAMARYDFLTGKYGLSNFINGRTPVESNFNFNVGNENNSYIIIVVISAVSVMSFGLALFLRKKRSK